MTAAMSQEGHTQILQGWLDQLRQGDMSRVDEVRAAILAHAGHSPFSSPPILSGRPGSQFFATPVPR